MKDNYDLIASIFDHDMALNMRFDDVGFYLERTAGKTSVLEVGCGTGRITIPLASACDDVVGIDASVPMLQQLKRKLDDCKLHLPSLTLTAMDARAICIRRQFEYIFFGFASVNYLAQEVELIGFLNSIKPLLTKNGRLLLDVFVPKPFVSNTLEWKQDYDRSLECGKRLKRFKQIIPEGRINIIRRRYEDYSVDGMIERVINTESRIHPYTPEELVIYLSDCGYELCGEWWDYGFGTKSTANFYSVEAKCI